MFHPHQTTDILFIPFRLTELHMYGHPNARICRKKKLKAHKYTLIKHSDWTKSGYALPLLEQNLLMSLCADEDPKRTEETEHFNEKH